MKKYIDADNLSKFIADTQYKCSNCGAKMDKEAVDG